MSARASAPFVPMQTAGTHHFIERTYRESSQFQWVRETLVNALEAGATRVEYGLEWQAVENKGVYRRMIADNGIGMNADQLVEFFNTFGGGGKPIGGAHENFGVGSKTSLLPWNHYGMVVISWVGGFPSMIWVKRDPETGEYGLKQEYCDGPHGEILESVYGPYDDPEHGCDWLAVKPDWIGDHGTVIVLLGNGPADNTVSGDPTRDEKDIKGISSFLNRRMWEIPEGVEVYVDELRTADPANWPPSEAIGHGPAAESATRDRRMNMRRIEGARHYIEYPNTRFTSGKLGARGTVPLRDGTAIDWYLWEGDRPKVQSYAAIGGYIAALYKPDVIGELYDVTAHHSTYRSFGVSDSSVRSRLWLIIRPPVDPEGKRGVYPKTDRNSLLIKGGPSAGAPLPINDWAAEFADNMPDELLQALRAASKGEAGTLDNAEWRQRLAERFGSRWRLARLRARQGGGSRLDPSIPVRPRATRNIPGPSPVPPTPPDNHVPRPRPAPRPVRPVYGRAGSTVEGEPASVNGGVPHYMAVNAEELGKGMLAAWQPNHPDYPEGVVLINAEHPVLRSVIEHWQLQYADHHAEAIEKDVIDVYGQVAVSKVAHSEHLKAIIPSDVVENSMRSEEALTVALLGLMAEDHLIATKVGGKYSKKRLPVAGRRRARSPVDSPQQQPG